MNRREFIDLTVRSAVASGLSRSRAQRPSAFDYIIVGAGSSGCVVANRLSADPKVRVLLIEAGPQAIGDPSLTTPGRWVSLIGSRFDWAYITEPDPRLNGRVLRWPRGKAVGGSSAINAMAYVRGHRLSFDGWRAETNASWSYDEVLPIFMRLEDNSRGASAFHATGGPIAVSDTTDPHAGHLAFLEAARQLGFGASPTWDFNGAQQENGAGFYQKNIRDGRRHSAAAAFLAPVLSRPNLTVWPNTAVHRLIFDGTRASAVDVLRDGKPVRVQVTREVVLAAGVIETPKLLMLSGIGPADALKRHGIRAIVDARGVGVGLHDHPRVSLRWDSRKPLPPSTVSAGLFASSRSASRREGGTSFPPDLQFYIGRGIDSVDQFITLTVALSVPTSRGSIALRSADPQVAPAIRPNYFADATDLDALVEGVRLARDLAATRAYDGLRGALVDPATALRTPDEMRAFIRRTADTIFHPVGSCRMGNAPDAPVDAQLRVKGADGVRVADASVMPTTVNSQTHAACVLIGERAASFIAAR